MRTVIYALALLSALQAQTVWAQSLTPAEEDARREAAIAEFTRKMQAANYPALFDQAAKEFSVPADILKGVAFAETRWEHFVWAPDDTASKATGMPRPYGIMSLWSNQWFGYSLVDAASLIGKTPGELREDPLQNIRGGAALLRKLYDENPKPDGTAPGDIESWRTAIRKYCAIPEPDLNAQHALDVYVFMSQGYHQYGIEWDARPVNLEPMRQDTRRIVNEERAKREALEAAKAAAPTTASQSRPPTSAPPVTVAVVSPPSPAVPVASSPRWLWLVLGAVVGLLIWLWLSRRKTPAGK
jgi:hypothetical protein